MKNMDKQSHSNSSSGGLKRKHKPIQPPSPTPNYEADDERRRDGGGRKDRREQPKRSVFRRLGGTPRENQPQQRAIRDCRHWVTYGTCSFGPQCSFAHPPLPQRHQQPKQHAPRTPPSPDGGGGGGRGRRGRPSPELSPRRPSRDEQNDSTTPTGIRSAVIVTQSSAEKSASKLNANRKIRLSDKKLKDSPEPQAPNMAGPGGSGNKYEFEFESAIELEKRRQELKRRLEELNDVTNGGPITLGPVPGVNISGLGGTLLTTTTLHPSLGSPKSLDKKKFRNSDPKMTFGPRSNSRDRDRDRDRMATATARERERDRVLDNRSAMANRRRPDYSSPKFERYLDSRGEDMRDRARDRISDQKPPASYRSGSRDDRDQRNESNMRRRPDFSSPKLDRDRYSVSRGGGGGENLREMGRHSAEKSRMYRSLNRDDRDSRANDNTRRRLDYSSPKFDRPFDARGDTLRDKRSLERPARDRNVRSSPMPPPRLSRSSTNQKPPGLAPPSGGTPSSIQSSSRLALLKQRRRNLRPLRQPPPSRNGSTNGGGGGGGPLSASNAVPLARRQQLAARYGGRDSASGGGTPRTMLKSSNDNRSSRRLPLNASQSHSSFRNAPSFGRPRLAGGSGGRGTGSGYNSAANHNAAYNALNKLRKIHAKRERERNERKSLKRPSDLNDSSFDKSTSSRPTKRFRADSEKMDRGGSRDRGGGPMSRGDCGRRLVDRPRSSRDRSLRRDGPLSPPSYRSSTRKSSVDRIRDSRRPLSGERFEKRDPQFINSFTTIETLTPLGGGGGGGVHKMTDSSNKLGHEKSDKSSAAAKLDNSPAKNAGLTDGHYNGQQHNHNVRHKASRFEPVDKSEKPSSAANHENSTGFANNADGQADSRDSQAGLKSESDADGGQELEPISDEEMQEDANVCTAAIEALRVDWSALTKDKTFYQSKSTPPPAQDNSAATIGGDQSESTAATVDCAPYSSPLVKFKPENFLNQAGLSAKLLGAEFMAHVENVVNTRLKEKGGGRNNASSFKFDPDKDSGNRSISIIKDPSERLKILNDVGPFSKALSARVDLRIRRKLCGFYAEPPEHLLLNTSEICVPYNEQAFETAKKLFLKNRQQVSAT